MLFVCSFLRLYCRYTAQQEMRSAVMFCRRTTASPGRASKININDLLLTRIVQNSFSPIVPDTDGMHESFNQLLPCLLIGEGAVPKLSEPIDDEVTAHIVILYNKT